MKKQVYLDYRLIKYIEFISEVEGKKFSRTLNYLVVLGLKKYEKIYNLEPNFFDTSWFDYDKRCGYHDYKVETNLLAQKRERIRKKLAELGRSFYENEE